MSPAPAPWAVASSYQPKAASDSTITVVAAIQVACTRLFPCSAGPSSSSPSRCRQTTIA